MRYYSRHFPQEQNSQQEAKMLTRSRAKAANQPIFVDDQWNDAYIHAKDEQIDAIHAQQLRDSGGGWGSDGDGSGSDNDSDAPDSDDPDADVWRSDDEANADSEDSEDEEQQQLAQEAEGDGGGDDATEPMALAGVSSSRLAGGGFAENLFWTVLTVLVVPMFMYSAVLKRYQSVLLLCCCAL